jgi:putative methyltransferase (TIGR04325 family)
MLIKIIKTLIPPIFYILFRKPKHSGITYSGDFDNWDEAQSFSTGYDSPVILSKVKEATLMVKSGKAEYERDSVLFDKIEYSLPIISGLLLAASKNNGNLRVLDFGGSLGSSYFQNRKFLKELSSVKWGVVEQTHYVECGKDFIQDDFLFFYDTIDECLADFEPNIIILGSVLQYVSEPYALLSKINKINLSILIIDKTPFSNLENDKICLQNVPNSIYKANYPIRIFSEIKILEKIKEWKILDEFNCKEINLKTENGVEFNYKSKILIK